MKLFITYEYFLPAYKAGGPIQSLANLVANYSHADIYIYCRNTDLDGTVLDVNTNEWVQFNKNTKVFYASAKSETSVYDLLTEVEPDVIFINGIFSPAFNLKPLLWSGDARKVVSARGMLHPGALSQKSLKKRIYLVAYKLLGLHKKCIFHVTTAEEKQYVINTFSKSVKVFVAPNFPNVVDKLPVAAKNAGKLKLVTIALISPMKNIKLVLEALSKCRSLVTYDIYGPVKDAAYWQECQQLIATMPNNICVQYHGAVTPDKILNTLTDYHCMIQPSKSENFGHALYEALAAGKLVITSHYTPWNKLEEANAGFNVDINNIQSIVDAIEKMASLDNEAYAASSSATAQYAVKSIDIASVKKDYDAMFLNR